MRMPTEDDPLRVVELFSGIGSQAMALRNIGIPYKVVGTSEVDRRAMDSYEAIHGPVNQLGDITKLGSLPECDLVTYSFPCLTGDTPVLTSKGYMMIRDIEPGDCVYSLDGRYHRVLSSGCTGISQTCRLKVKGRREVRCTWDHRFLGRLSDRTDDWLPAGTFSEGSLIVLCDGDTEGGQHLSLSEVEYVRPTLYSEKVYDLTIEGSSSFVVDGIVTHNCQDLSIAGYKRGMARGSGTRSALLWEVGRLLEDAQERGALPDCLLMENVPAILNRKNIDSFQQWIAFLDSVGYTSSYAVLNATDFGVPQNRKRCFMVSALDGRRFIFPQGHPTERRLRDILEDDVPESYFLSDDKIAKYEAHKQRHDSKGHGLGWEPKTPGDETRALTAIPSRHSQNFLVTEGSIEEYRREHEAQGQGTGIRIAGRMTDSDFEQTNRVYDPDGKAPTITSTACKGVVPKVELSEQGQEASEPEIAIAGTLRTNGYEMMGRVYGTDGVAPTLTTMATGGNQMPKIEVSDPGRDVVSTSGKDSGLIIAGRLDTRFAQDSRVHDFDGTSPTLCASRPTHMPLIEVKGGPVHNTSEGGDSDDR